MSKFYIGDTIEYESGIKLITKVAKNRISVYYYSNVGNNYYLIFMSNSQYYNQAKLKNRSKLMSILYGTELK